MHHPTDRIIHTTAFVTPVMEHWLEREIAQWVHPMKDRFWESNVLFINTVDVGGGDAAQLCKCSPDTWLIGDRIPDSKPLGFVLVILDADITIKKMYCACR